MLLLKDNMSLHHPAVKLAALTLVRFQHDKHRQLTVNQDHRQQRY